MQRRLRRAVTWECAWREKPWWTLWNHENDGVEQCRLIIGDTFGKRQHEQKLLNLNKAIHTTQQDNQLNSEGHVSVHRAHAVQRKPMRQCWPQRCQGQIQRNHGKNSKHLVTWHYEHATRNDESHASETVSGERMLKRTLKRSLTCGFFEGLKIYIWGDP